MCADGLGFACAHILLTQGIGGDKAPGFPSSHASLAHTSPFLVDLGGEGVLGLALYDGEIVFTSQAGALLPLKITVPPLSVQKDWHSGLAADALDHSQADLKDGARRRRLLQTAGDEGSGAAAFEAFQSNAESWGSEGSPSGDASDPEVDSDAALDPFRASDAFREHSDAYDGLDYSGGLDSEFGWGGADPSAPPARMPGEEDAGEGTLRVDAHILCTPTVADLDGDGTPELLVAVSYFFDKDRYVDPVQRAALPPNITLSNYLATGLVVYDMQTLRVRWKRHLDLSTDGALFKAFAYSSPSAADVDMDGRLEIFVGTSVGFLYSFSADGTLRSSFPLQLGDVQASPGLADVDGDGELELIALDTRGNVGCFSALTAAEKWERHLASMAAQAPIFADVNGDGVLDVVLGTADGRVHALHGTTGADVAHFPFRTGARVMAPVMPLPAASGAMTLVVASFDGLVYFIDGKSGCADTFDVGEMVYGSPLADDMDGDGRTEVVLATMNGNVLCLSTARPHLSLAAWPAQAPGGHSAARLGWYGVRVSAATRAGAEVSGHTFSAAFTVEDVRPGGAKAAAQFARRRAQLAEAALAAAGDGGAAKAAPGAYRVVATLRVEGRTVSVTAGSYRAPGTYALQLPVPAHRGHGVVTVVVTDPHGLTAADSYGVAFHTRYQRLLKWLLVAPFTAMALALAWTAEGGHRGGLLGAVQRVAQD